MTILWQEISHILINICGEKYVYTDLDELYMYERDQTMHLHCAFDILVKPGTPDEISTILKICNQYKIPVTPRGGGSGVTGGALPFKGGIVLSLERLNTIISINQLDGYVITESGVITANLCNAVEEAGLYFPVIPSSKKYSFVGGNVAENAGSINSCKYGTTGQYVLNLEVVLPCGDIIWTGANVIKNVTGLNLTQLFVGSEGILGIITKVVYKLVKIPQKEISLLAGFTTLKDACNAVFAIKQSNISPSALELITDNALRFTANYLKEPLPLIKENIQAHILIELHEVNALVLDNALIDLCLLLEKYTAEEILVADAETEKDKLRKLRLSIGSAMTSYGKTYRDIDTCIPLSFLYEYITGVELICKIYTIPLICFGHALDGNLHTMLLLNKEMSVGDENNYKEAVSAVFNFAIKNGGVISGEHGIGLLQKEFMNYQFSTAQIEIMKKIKAVFDPNFIINPGKVF